MRKTHNGEQQLVRFVTDRSCAELQLRSAVEPFEQLLPERGELPKHVDWLFRAIDQAGGEWVALDCDELQFADRRFAKRLQRILRWLEDPGEEIETDIRHKEQQGAMTKAEKVRYIRSWVTAPLSEISALLDQLDDPDVVIRQLLEGRTAVERKRDSYAALINGRAETPKVPMKSLVEEICYLPEGRWHLPEEVPTKLSEDPDAERRLAALMGREDQLPTIWEQAQTQTG